jgi:hypothetical protein
MNETGVKCEHCGRAIGDADAFCPRCGRAAWPEQLAPGPGTDAYLKLVKANVLRLRRQWTAAEAQCSEVLGRDPGNATACSVMGDVLRDQGKLRDAIEWYKMALDRNPASESDRKKLEALIDRVFSSPRPGLRGRVWDAVRDRVTAAGAEVRLARAPVPVGLIVGAVLAALLVIGVTGILLGRAGRPEAASAASQTSSGAFSVRAAPMNAMPGAEATGAGTAAVGSAQTPPVDETLAADIVSWEQGLLSYLREAAASADPNCQVHAVEMDPRTGLLSVQFSMPRLWSPVTARQNILRSVGSLAAAAREWDETIAKMRVRCDVRESAGGTRFAMLGEGNPQEMAKLDQVTGRSDPERFTYVWWHPDLRQADDTQFQP